LSRTVGSGFLNISKSENFQFWVSEAKKKIQNKKITGFDYFLKPQSTHGFQRRMYSFTDGCLIFLFTIFENCE